MMPNAIGKFLWLTLALSGLAGAVVARDDTRADAFAALLAEAELITLPIADSVELEPRTNAVMDYERAVRTQDGALEIRYAVRPLKRLRIEYDDPHGSAPDPNHIFPLIFESLAVRLSAGTHAPTQEYAATDARQLFNADWAAAAAFDVKSAFATDYSQGVLLALHRNRVADAYAVFLYDDYGQVKVRLKAAMGNFIFRVPAALSVAD